MPLNNTMELGQLATLACILEVTTPKPGNVHRGADFEDATFIDFLASAVASGPILAQSGEVGIGPTVLTAARATAEIAGTNTNLGTLLLLAPLAAVPADIPLSSGVQAILRSMTARDSAAVYEAIQTAGPAGLQRVASNDVHGAAPNDLLAAMADAAERDLIARQYTNDFAQVFEAHSWLLAAHHESKSLQAAVVHTHLRLMAEFPDSLIARKCGPEVAAEAAQRAAAAIGEGATGDPAYLQAVADLDFWLRSDHHRRNPGTTADMIAAILFVGLREGHLQPPFK
jgi:triphosphoribosyl-dephospho-CoA synthase